MNTLAAYRTAVAAAVTHDPVLLLASAFSTFDPYWNLGDEEDYDEDPLRIALRVTRDAFPDIYALAVDHLRNRAPHTEIDRLICGAITAKSIPVDDLNMIGWGIPLSAFGVDLSEPEFYEAQSDLLPLLGLFGVSLLDEDGGSAGLSESAYEIGRTLAASLLEQTNPMLRQVGCTLGWLFSCTGNSLVDCTDEGLADFEPVRWTKDEIEFAIEMITEADKMMHDAMAGLKWLNAEPTFISMLKRNIAAVQHAIQKGKRREHNIKLEWAHLGIGIERTADADTLVLQLRPDAA